VHVGREPDQPAPQPSDAERSGAEALLHRAVGQGKLTLEEFSDRVGRIWAAERTDQIAAATAGLVDQDLGTRRTVSTVIAFFGRQQRAGRWRVPTRLRAIGLFGDISLDLQQAVCSEESVHIHAWTFLGDIELHVPDGVEVVLTGFDVFGDRDLQVAPIAQATSIPSIRVNAHTLLGRVRVESPSGHPNGRDRPRSLLGRRLILIAGLGVLASALWFGGGDQVSTPVAGAEPTGPATAGTAQATVPPGPESTMPSATPSPASSAITPGVVGRRLTEARAAFVAAGFVTIDLVDGSGQGRVVVNPDNWIVQGQYPPAGSPASPAIRAVLTVVKPTDSAGGIVTISPGVVPEVVCTDLQTAQDRLQAAGFTHLRSVDGSGQGRMQIVNRNWIVVSQSVNAGSRPPTDTVIVLTVVKYGEPTGVSGCPS